MTRRQTQTRRPRTQRAGLNAFPLHSRLAPSLAHKIRTRSLRAGGANCWGQKLLSRNQRLKSHFLAETFSTHSRLKLSNECFKERRTLDQSSLANGRAGPETDSTRPFTVLDQSSSANGRAGPKTDPARPFAELDQTKPVFAMSS